MLRQTQTHTQPALCTNDPQAPSDSDDTSSEKGMGNETGEGAAESKSSSNESDAASDAALSDHDSMGVVERF
jgi:hypothetical protein